MKRVALLLSILVLGLSAKARPDYEILDCQGEKHSFARATLYLDATKYVKGSEYSAPVGASLVFNYSGTQGMVCDGLVKGDDVNVSCVGFYNSFEDDIALVKFKTLNDGTYKAYWTTAKSYGSVPMETTCIRIEDKYRRN